MSKRGVKQKQLNQIDRFLHTTTEPFDNWFWDGRKLEIVMKDRVIEEYQFTDLKEIIEDFG